MMSRRGYDLSLYTQGQGHCQGQMENIFSKQN